MHDVAIIGGGPGGYAAALYAHNFGLSVALVESGAVGGTCLHRGCIPAKAWLHTAEVFQEVAGAAEVGVVTSAPQVDWDRARERKDAVVSQLHKGLQGLLKARKVEVIAGTGRLAGPGVVDVTGADGAASRLEARKVIVATGSAPRAIPGYEPDGRLIVTSDHALDWDRMPGRVAIIGAGAIGVEFAGMLADLGSEVHLFEVMEQVLPGFEPEAARLLQRLLERRGVKVHAGTAVDPPSLGTDSVVVPFGGDSVEVDAVLVAVGRAPVTAGIGLEEAGVKLNGGFIAADLATMLTDAPGVYAVGDVVGGTPQLAHAAFAEGIAAITHIATGTAAPVEYRAIPLVVYASPEVAQVGLTERQAIDAGYPVETHDHGIAGVGRAIIKGQTQGLVKLVVRRNGPILGATVVGPAAGEMIHELMYAVGWEALPAEAAAFVHAHPTLSEAVGESLLAASGRSLH
ncbi:MAG: dihydrolipoyl dehydrogenase [Acidimicrobiia bacterium]|nr:MAG: dihydrolipoyl dehydrogenase [Acidimicrobiia bacterium]